MKRRSYKLAVAGLMPLTLDAIVFAVFLAAVFAALVADPFARAATAFAAGRETEPTLDGAAGVSVRRAPDAEALGAGHGDIAHFTCSMHPSVRSATSGTCPICAMDLVAVTRGEIETGTIRLDERQRQLIGVKTGTVERRPAALSIRAVGHVAYDETRLTDVTLKFRGWAGEVYADFTGMPVEQGDELFTVYAPELLSAQEELLASARRSTSAGRAPSRLLGSARRRLLLWGMTEAQISKLLRLGKASTFVPIHSPAGGVVIEKSIVDGSSIEAGAQVYRIADLSHVWIEADVYEADLQLLAEGDEASVTLPYLPGERIEGTIDYVYPYLDPATRTGRLRLVVANPDGRLKPGMYADVELSVQLGEQLLVPEDAVLRAGKTDVVFVALGEGRFKSRTIELGRRTTAGYIVVSGLEPGDSVVTSGNFLVAAESKLKAGIDQW